MLTAVCGGEGSCGRCIVKVMEGRVSPPTSTEEAALGAHDVAAGWRLACQSRVEGDVRVHVPPESLVTAQRMQTEGQAQAMSLAPAVRARAVDITAPSLTDLRSDALRLRDALSIPELELPLPVLRRLSPDLRSVDFHPTLFLRGATVVGIRPTGTTPLGLAVDIGTTKLAGYLLDLETGQTRASAGAMNPQIAYGEDVMARISHAVGHQNGSEQLRSAIVDALNSLARELCAEAGRNVLDIADAVLVGNTAMHHLCLGLSVKHLGVAPYVAAESAALDLPSQDVGLDLAPGAYVHLLPNIAGFVGADHVAMLLATGLPAHPGVALAMDIGTNTEISLVARGRHWACSTASGPAFEGAHIRCGMRAAPGAIEEVLIHNGRVQIKTVDEKPAVGLCGSGILDLVAQMRRAGIIDRLGAMHIHDGQPRVRQGDRGPEFVVVTESESDGREITFSRADVSEIQLAKGAMRAGIEVLLERAGVTEADLDEVIIAGAFGTYLDVQSGIEIGMFPRLDHHRFRQVGNAAGAGARMALLSVDQRQAAVRIARHVEYVELTAESDFSSRFARGILLE